MKQCTTSCSVRGLRAKTQRNRSHGPIEVVKAQNTNTPESRKNVKKLGRSLLVRRQSGRATLKDSWRFLTNTSLFLDRIAVMSVGICIKKLKTRVQLKAKTQMLIAALSTTPKLWEQIPSNQDLLQWRIDK